MPTIVTDRQRKRDNFITTNKIRIKHFKTPSFTEQNLSELETFTNFALSIIGLRRSLRAILLQGLAFPLQVFTIFHRRCFYHKAEEKK